MFENIKEKMLIHFSTYTLTPKVIHLCNLAICLKVILQREKLFQ